MADRKKKAYTFIITAVKLLIIVSIGVFIYFKLRDEDNFNAKLFQAMRDAVSHSWYILLIVILLMPLNWLLEAKKWQALASPVTKLNIVEALKGVLAGLSIGFITPHGVGAYVGRVLMLSTNERGKLLGAVLLSRLLQMLATLIFGSLGVGYLFGLSVMLVYLLLVSCLVVSGLLLLNLNLTIKKKWLKTIMYYIDIVKAYSWKRIMMVFTLAILRYVVFATQFILVLTMFIKGSFLLKAAGVTWVFLAKSVLPTFNFLSDLGVREFSAIYFFDHYHVSLIPVLAASLLVWCINILTPTVFGAPLVMRLKVRL